MYVVNENNILIDDTKISFRNTIDKVIEYDTILLVLLEYEANSGFFQNVYGIDKGKKNISWQIPRLETEEYEGKIYPNICHPYVGIRKVDKKTVRLINWDGTQFNVDVETGQPTTSMVEFRRGKRPW